MFGVPVTGFVSGCGQIISKQWGEWYPVVSPPRAGEGNPESVSQIVSEGLD